MRWQKILVPLDRSALAERALPLALELARQTEAELILFHAALAEGVMPPAGHAYDLEARPLPLPDLKVAGRAYLELITSQYGRAGVRLHSLLTEGDAAAGLVTAARRHQVELIVMTTHGYAGIDRWLMGSVTEQVLRTAPCPVLALRQPRPIRHIMITLDGSALAESSLTPGLALADQLGARVTLFSVAAPPAYRDLSPPSELDGSDGPTGALAAHRRPAKVADQWRHNYLAALARALEAPGRTIDMVVASGHPTRRILDFAHDAEVDLIAMATHGRSGLSRLALGSVTESVLRQAAIALLVIRVVELPDED